VDAALPLPVAVVLFAFGFALTRAESPAGSATSAVRGEAVSDDARQLDKM
jgi:hypothetical protein